MPVAETTTHREIPRQVRLPLKIAFEVVMQGIRIRFGRSVVTVTGVICGIAFLMSILTGQALKKGVSAEDALRWEVNRMSNFLTTESGPALDRTFAVLPVGELEEPEERLLLRLQSDGAAGFRVESEEALALMPDLVRQETRVAPTEALTEGASALIIMGGEAPERDWNSLLEPARQKIIAWSQNIEAPETSGDIVTVALARKPSEAVLEEQEREAKKERFRSAWIVIISLLVTVMGITNAMLMSVTERFREIGTMKCLGALSSFVRTMFLIESGLMGLVGGLVGALFGAFFSMVLYGFTYGFSLTAASLGASAWGLIGAGFLSLLAGFGLSILAALYPAQVASSMVPATALRSNV